MPDSTYQTKVYHKQGGDELVVKDSGCIEFQAGATLSVDVATLVNIWSTSFTMYSGASASLNSYAAINLASGATLSLGCSAIGTMYSNADWAVYSNANINFQSGAILSVGNSALLNIKSDAYISIQSAANFYYGSLSTMNAIQIGALLLNQGKTLRVMESQGAGSGVLSIVSIPVHTRYVFVSASGATSNGSMQLYSCLLGEKLRIQLAGSPTKASVSFCVAASGLHGAAGVSLVGMSNGTVLSALAIDGSAQTGLWVELAGIADGTWAVVGKSDTTFVVERSN